MKTKLFITIILAMVLMSCVTASKISRVNLGMTKSEVIKALGKPVSTSASNGVEYFNYAFSETPKQAWGGFTVPYFVRIIDGKVDAYGRYGDFGIKFKKD